MWSTFSFGGEDNGIGNQETVEESNNRISNSKLWEWICCFGAYIYEFSIYFFKDKNQNIHLWTGVEVMG